MLAVARKSLNRWLFWAYYQTQYRLADLRIDGLMDLQIGGLTHPDRLNVLIADGSTS